jgi:Asp-tRNA(Asn)/Glu-tRNA(Gln) amidotransferase A subunit family amidase
VELFAGWHSASWNRSAPEAAIGGTTGTLRDVTAADGGAELLIDRVRRRESSCRDICEEHLSAIGARDGDVRAWEVVDPERVLAEADRLDALPADEAARLPLLGLPVGIKDVFDTADLPTAYGSPIYQGHRPATDAAAVARLRHAGAIVLGKTKTTEFAFMTATDTRNPVAPGHTPGGSSSGSAAAVAAGMVAVATGTQTAGSVVRPASYCEVVGYKPTFGLLSRAGVLPLSASLDTVGLFARSARDAALVGSVLATRDPRAVSVRPALPSPWERADRVAASGPRLALLRAGWSEIEAPARAAVERFVERCAAAGAEVEELEGLETASLAQAQEVIQLRETAASLAWEAEHRDALLSEDLRAALERGRGIGDDAYRAARRLADERRWAVQERFAPFDAVIAPSTLGPPPVGLSWTGDPALCRPWTLLGVPAVAIPGARTADGLPAGVQLLGPALTDRRVLGVADWLQLAVAPSTA